MAYLLGEPGSGRRPGRARRLPHFGGLRHDTADPSLAPARGFATACARIAAPLRSPALILLPVLLTAALRLPALAARPMHADEAIHADKLGTLLEGGGYAYDPSQYHGPTLYYLT